MKATLIYQGPAILWALFVLIICSVNLGSSGKFPLFFKGFDKITHTGLFFTLTVLYCNGAIRQQKPVTFSYKQAFIIVVAGIFYGGLIELLQWAFFTWRSAEWSDLFCDVLGTCMGIFGVMLTVSAIGNEEK
jgi:VanZ family protein